VLKQFTNCDFFLCDSKNKALLNMYEGEEMSLNTSLIIYDYCV